MKRHILPAAVLCGAMLLNTLPAGASYSGDDIAFVLRPTGDTAVSDDGCIHVTAGEAAAGKTFHFGIYLETDRAEIQNLGISLCTNSKQLSFVQDSLLTGTMVADNAAEQSYQLPDGTVFSTKYKPYCLGYVNSKGSYSPNCNTFSAACDDGSELTLYWLSGIEQATTFVGGQSDWFSFFEFDAALAPGTQPGSYRLDFQTAADAATAKAERLTYVTSNDGTIAKAHYESAIPVLQGIEIVVDGSAAWELGDVDHDGLVNACDATMILVYASKMGTGGSDISEEEHQNMHALGDVNGDGQVNAKDATGINRYSAARGVGKDVTWADIFS